MGKIIGIDLGTTNSAVAVMEGGEPVIIPSAEGSRLYPSVVAVNPKTGERLVGQVAEIAVEAELVGEDIGQPRGEPVAQMRAVTEKAFDSKPALRLLIR